MLEQGSNTDQIPRRGREKGQQGVGSKVVWRWASGKRDLSEAVSRKDCEARTVSLESKVDHGYERSWWWVWEERRWSKMGEQP